MSWTRALGLLGVAYLALILCSVLPALLPEHVPVPDVALLVALHAGLTCRLAGPSAALREGGPASMAAFGLSLGYLADLMSGAPKGLHALALALLVLVLRGAATQLLVRGASLVIAFSALCALVFSFALGLLRAWAQPGTGWPGPRRLLLHAAVTALCAPPLFALLHRVDARCWRERAPAPLWRDRAARMATLLPGGRTQEYGL